MITAAKDEICFAMYVLSPAHIVNMIKQRTIFFILIIIIHVCFFIKAIQTGQVFTKDSYEYIQQAKNIKNNNSWYCGDMNTAIQPALYSQRTPGYGAFIFVLKQINNSIWFLLIMQSLLSIFNFYVLYRLLQQLSIKINLFVLLIPLFAFPSQFIYSNLVMSEMLLQTCVLLSFYFLVQFIRSKSASAIWLYQLFITCALLVKPIWYLFPFVSILFFIWLVRQKQVNRFAIFTHLIPITIVAGIFFHNHQQTNYWEYSSIQRKLMINYNVFEVLEQLHGKELASLMVDSMQDEAAIKKEYHEQAASLQQQINNLLWAHPFTFAWIETKGIVKFFTDHSRYDIESFFSQVPAQVNSWQQDFKLNRWTGLFNHFKTYNLFYLFYLFLSMVINAFVLFCLFLFAKQKSISLHIRIALVLMIIYTALLTGPTGTTRFRLPVFPLLLLSFAVVLPIVQQWIKKRFLFYPKSS